MYSKYLDLAKKYRWFIAGGLIVLILIAVGAHYAFKKPPPPIDAPSEFKSANFSFTYPRLFTAVERTDGAVALGGKVGDSFIPLVDVVRYKTDPDAPAPASFETFAARQAQALCGSDAEGVSLACTSPVTKVYTTPAGLVGEEMSLTLVARNLKSGTTTSSTYGPVYIFNTSQKPDPGEAVSYQAVFVYPDFYSFTLASSSAALVPDVAATLVITKGASVHATTTAQ